MAIQAKGDATLSSQGDLVLGATMSTSARAEADGTRVTETRYAVATDRILTTRAD